jgi:hypothetical protein
MKGFIWRDHSYHDNIRSHVNILRMLLFEGRTLKALCKSKVESVELYEEESLGLACAP